MTKLVEDLAVDLKESIDLVKRMIYRFLVERDRARAEAARYREALEYIAHFDDEYMETARTLHYDMRWTAREAMEQGLALQQGTGGHADVSASIQ